MLEAKFGDDSLCKLCWFKQIIIIIIIIVIIIIKTYIWVP